MGAVHAGQSTGNTFAGYSDLEVTVCTCGVLFAMPEKMLDQRRYDGRTFYCPHGHRLSFAGDQTRQEKALAQAKDRAAYLRSRLDQTESSLVAHKGAATRARNERDRERKRVAAGVCPCCDRTFKDVARHMASQHPDFPPQTEESKP